MVNSAKEIIDRLTVNPKKLRANATAKDEKIKDFLLRENSNFVENIQLIYHNIQNHEDEKYLFEEIFEPEVQQLYKDGTIYVHDKKLMVYCNSLSCREIATKGIPSLAANMHAPGAPKHVSSLVGLMSNAVTLLSQQTSGAVMLSQMVDVMASYLFIEEMENKVPREWLETILKQEFQSLICELNMPLRSGSQSSFSNITLNFGKPSDEIRDEYVVYGGAVKLFTYSDIPVEYYDKVTNLFIEALYEENIKSKVPLTFPLITVPIDDNFKYDNPSFLDLLKKMYVWGGCYFENFTTPAFGLEKYTSKNPLIKPKDPETSRSMCCRLNIDMKVLARAGGGIFGSSVGNTGAVQVININLVKLFLDYKYKFNEDWDKLIERLYEIMDVIEQAMMDKREWLEANKHLYPTFFAYNKDLKNYFNVFAVTGMHEALITLGYDGGMNNEEGKELTHKFMQAVHERIDYYIVRDKVAVALEAAPKMMGGIQ